MVSGSTARFGVLGAGLQGLGVWGGAFSGSRCKA